MLWSCSISGSCLVLEEKKNLGAFQWRSGTVRLTSPMAPPAQPALGGTKNVALSRTGHTGGLGKWGAQGLNGCGVKQLFRTDTARPEVVIHLLLLRSDGYWATVVALSEIEFR